ncbi:MAG TPA: lamin tail domain-containing protein, partial [Nannocystis exedens]|nr:lamin tail domain-containing protein [Nannocystis exedens]
MSCRFSMRLASTIAFAAALSCARAPLERICPELQVGDLVVTEIRGKQAGADTYGEWIELYNATDEAIDLGGISVDLFKLDGSGEFHFIVRDADVEIPPRGYAVLAGAVAADKNFTSYAYDSDEDGSLYAGAFVEVYSCEHMIDSMLYRALPNLGTLSLDGTS